MKTDTGCVGSANKNFMKASEEANAHIMRNRASVSCAGSGENTLSFPLFYIFFFHSMAWWKCYLLFHSVLIPTWWRLKLSLHTNELFMTFAVWTELLLRI